MALAFKTNRFVFFSFLFCAWFRYFSKPPQLCWIIGEKTEGINLRLKAAAELAGGDGCIQLSSLLPSPWQVHGSAVWMFFPAGSQELRCIGQERHAERREQPKQLRVPVEGRSEEAITEKPEEEKGLVDSILCFHIWGQIMFALTCSNWYIQGLTRFSLTCSSDHVICRCVASPEGGTRAQKPNLHAHIHPGNLISSSITDNMLLVSQKKDNTQGYNPPTRTPTVLIYTSNCTCAPGLYILVPPPPVTVGYQLQNWTIYEITVALSGSLRPRGLIFCQEGKIWWLDSMFHGCYTRRTWQTEAVQVNSWFIFLCSVQKWPLALALLTSGSERLQDSSTVRHKKIICQFLGDTMADTHALDLPPRPDVNLPPGVQIRPAPGPLGCTLVHISHHCQHILVFKTEPITCEMCVEPLRTTI